MDYFQGVVAEYLQQSVGAVFVKTECLIQLEPGKVVKKGKSWYCDVIAVNFKKQTAYLCEVSYSTTLSALANRLRAWSENWQALRTSLKRDYSIPESWQVEPLVFIPEKLNATFEKKLQAVAKGSSGAGTNAMPSPKVRYLERVTPWMYRPWYETTGEPLQTCPIPKSLMRT